MRFPQSSQALAPGKRRALNLSGQEEQEVRVMDSTLVENILLLCMTLWLGAWREFAVVRVCVAPSTVRREGFHGCQFTA